MEGKDLTPVAFGVLRDSLQMEMGVAPSPATLSPCGDIFGRLLSGV